MQPMVFYTYIWDCFTETTDESEGEIKLRPQETRKVDFFLKSKPSWYIYMYKHI